MFNTAASEDSAEYSFELQTVSEVLRRLNNVFKEKINKRVIFPWTLAVYLKKFRFITAIRI